VNSETNSLPNELNEIVAHLREKARGAGLDFFTTLFELVDYKQLNEIAAYGGFPTRYPHWRWGMEYERLSKSYTYGLSVIYEMVINNDPCYAYLLRANSLVSQKTVIAHVYAHSDFFKNNFWFSKTNRKMLDQMANHSSIVRNIINEIGQEEVENFIDICLSLENLIDIQAPFKAKPKVLSQEDKEKAMYQSPTKIESKSYMDSYVNPEAYLKKQQEQIIQQAKKLQTFPEEPVQDILKFLIEYAPMSTWQRRILSLIRDEHYYFAPQIQTKILNEGWATYWHSKMMTSTAPLDASEIIDYCDQYSGVVANHPGQMNPYRLGVELLRHIEERWNKGRFGKEYIELDDPKTRNAWNKDSGLGMKKLFEVRSFHNDITFIDEFLDEDFCHKSKMFLYDYNTRTGKYVITNRDFKEIKKAILKQLTNIGQPIIKITDANYKNRGELLLSHAHDGEDLKHDYLLECLKNLYKIWTRPVHIETVVENLKRRIVFDGSTHSIEKV
jgi:stage V sporulation protein R